MDKDRFLALVEARPFRPFSVEVRGGARVRVGHPECVTLTTRKDGVAIAVTRDDETLDLFDAGRVRRVLASDAARNR